MPRIGRDSALLTVQDPSTVIQFNSSRNASSVCVSLRACQECEPYRQSSCFPRRAPDCLTFAVLHLAPFVARTARAHALRKPSLSGKCRMCACSIVWYTRHKEVMHVREDTLFTELTYVHLRHAVAHHGVFERRELRSWIGGSAPKQRTVRHCERSQRNGARIKYGRYAGERHGAPEQQCGRVRCRFQRQP